MSVRRLLAAAALLIAGASTAQAHAKLLASEPAASSHLSVAPAALLLHFNEALEPAFSSIRLQGADGAQIALPAAGPDKADPHSMTAPLPALRAGRYQVRWVAMTRDGHKTAGEFSFTIKRDGS